MPPQSSIYSVIQQVLIMHLPLAMFCVCKEPYSSQNTGSNTDLFDAVWFIADEQWGSERASDFPPKHLGY